MTKEEEGGSWKLTLPCTRAEAEAIGDHPEMLADLTPPPALMTREIEEDNPDRWQLEVFFEGKPDEATIAIIHTLIPGSAEADAVPERLPDEDWVALSQQGLEPVRAGRFHVRNHAEDPVPEGAVPLLIPAGQAFGTGQHETTAGCLAMLDRLKRVGSRFVNVADVGTGTGVLAFASHRLWPSAWLTASDIDPASVRVTAENARLNGVSAGTGRGRLAVVCAAGVDHPALIGRGPYDLVIANILAGPLIELAPSLCAVLADGGTLVVAGLLEQQADAVVAAYRRQGLRLVDRIDHAFGANGHWPTLRLRKRPAIGWKRPRRWSADAVGDSPGFGSW